MDKIEASSNVGYGSSVRICYREIIDGEVFYSEDRGYLTFPDINADDAGDWDTDGIVHLTWTEEEGDVSRELLCFKLEYLCGLEEIYRIIIGNRYD